MKSYWGMSKLELFLDGFRNIWYIIDCYTSIHENPEEYEFIREDFFEALSWGWMAEYIFPYDDYYNLTISPERKLRLNEK